MAAVYCPRCGTPNEPDDRFCSACGASLKKTSEPKEQLSPRERLGRIVGTTRRARWITGATLAALVAAVVAFIALEPSEDGIPRDAYTISADQLCLNAKSEIVSAERHFGRQAGGGTTSALAHELVPIVAAWRSDLGKLAVPADRAALARELEAALLEAEIQIAALARVAARGDERATLVSAKRADAATSGVEAAAASLGLSRCAAETIGLTPG